MRAAYHKQWPIGRPQPSNFRYNSRTPYWVFKEMVQESGYDALIVEGYGIRTGGKQLFMFDPKNVTIIGDGEAFDKGPYEPPDLFF